MRDYDPTTGRYIQADPLGLVDGASVFGYALQNPGRYTDPYGLSVGPGHRYYELCKSLERRMNNIRIRIVKRILDLKEDKHQLPESAPGRPPRDSRQGHRDLIEEDRDTLKRLEKEYAKKCNCDDDEGSGGSTGAAIGLGGAATIDLLNRLGRRSGGSGSLPISPIPQILN